MYGCRKTNAYVPIRKSINEVKKYSKRPVLKLKITESKKQERYWGYYNDNQFQFVYPNKFLTELVLEHEDP